MYTSVVFLGFSMSCNHIISVSDNYILGFRLNLIVSDIDQCKQLLSKMYSKAKVSFTHLEILRLARDYLVLQPSVVF